MLVHQRVMIQNGDLFFLSFRSVAAARPHMPEQRMDGISSSSSDTCGAMAQAELIIPTVAVNQEGQMEKPWRWGADTCWVVRVLWVVFPLPNLLCILYSISPRIDCFLLLSSATIYHKDREKIRFIAFIVLILTHFLFLPIPSLYRVCAAGKVS